MMICNRCGRSVGEHKQPAIRALCGKVKSDPAKVQADTRFAIDYIRQHAPTRRHSPTRSHSPRVIH